jgi:hypothetical protein
MKRLLTLLALFGVLSLGAAPVLAQDKAADKPAAEAPRKPKSTSGWVRADA